MVSEGIALDALMCEKGDFVFDPGRNGKPA